LKKGKLVLAIMIATALLVSMWVPTTNPMTSSELVHETSSTSVVSYVPHGYISINGDDDFNETAYDEGWAGDGSSEDPFIIEGYEIVHSEGLIHIRDTRYHFEIRDCNLTDGGDGVYLNNVTNGLIENCLIVDVYYGVRMINVTGIDIVGCDIFVDEVNGRSGVYMEEAIDCSVSSCVMEGVSGSEAGIYGEECDGITLFNNTVFDFDNHGIFVLFSDEIDILNNTVYGNEGEPMEPCGIDVIVCPLVDIIGNNVTANYVNGISVQGSDNATVLQNHIMDNYGHGVFVELSDYCVIQDNYIYGNGDGLIEEGPACGVFTVWSDYCQIIDNEFWWNALNSITLGYSEHAYVFNNYMNHSFVHGVEVYMSHNASVLANEIYNSYGNEEGPACGILMQWSNDTQILDNILDHNSENGITIVNSHIGELHANRISDSEYYGIHMIAATEWYISHNIIYDNGGPGILLDETLDNYLWYNDIGWSGEFLVVDNGDNQWNYAGAGNWYSDYNGTSVYNITGAGSAVDFDPSMSLYLGTTTPFEYEAGTVGNTMTWDASALNPGGYELLIDGATQGHETWDGTAIAADVDGLPVGVYNVTLIVYHISGHWLANQSILTVVDIEAPTWTVTPADQVLDYNVALSYQLEASDPSGIDSWAVNDTAQFAISASGLVTNATTLEPGVYYLEVTVTDTESNSVTVTIMITVNALVPPTPPLDPAMILAIGGVGAGVIIILLVVVLKKKGT